MDTRSYAIDVRSILEDLGATIAIDASIELPDIVVGSEEYSPDGPGRLELAITNTGAGIVASGVITVALHAVCSRCLAPFVLPLATDVDGFYVARGHERDLPDEQEYGFVEEGAIDVMPAILAALTLDVPFAPLHDPDCKGICPTCGADLNASSCDCASDDTSSPFAVLKDLLSGTDGTT